MFSGTATHASIRIQLGECCGTSDTLQAQIEHTLQRLTRWR